MVAGEFDSRIQNALVSKWPDSIDVCDGIFVPGKVEKWHRELVSALRTRNLLNALQTTSPSIEDLCDQFPNEDIDILVAAHDEMLSDRTRGGAGGAG